MSLYSDPIDTHGHTVADAVAIYGSTLARGTEVTLSTSAAADDIIDAVGHGFAAGDIVVFNELTGGTGLSANTPYRVSDTSLAADTFRVKAATGGADLGFTADITAGTVAPLKVGRADDYDASAGDMFLAQTADEVEAQM